MSNSDDHWQCKLDDFSSRLRFVRENKVLTDCEIKAGKRTFRAHKLILAMASPVFEKLFFGFSNFGYAVLEDAQTFSYVLDYIYQGVEVFPSIEVATKVMHAAKKYSLPFLEKRCSQYVSKIMSTNNACKVYEFAKSFKDDGLLEASMKLIQNETSTVLDECHYKTLRIGTLFDILDWDRLKVVSEIELFEAIVKYAEAHGLSMPSEDVDLKSLFGSEDETDAQILAQEASNEDSSMDIENHIEVLQIQQAIRKVRFLAMSVEQFAQGPASSKWLMKYESFSIFMNIVAPALNVPLPDGFSSKGQRCI